ncbi:heterokaryon incompatibility protein-domain-containing protein [Xylaria sp. FL1777]|nr:heterokaryon incompatibility protein-domain-containing protein [Xylaria sp. FL1777]
MWLIDTSTLKLKFVTEAEKGSYVILSHTWGDDEVSFEQFRRSDPAWLDDARQQDGFSKIAKTCELAALKGFSYAWIDTCCIDKSSSAELSEAINSMFKYYQDAAFCIAFISDLPTTEPLDFEFENRFPHCRWLTRGWTLQELIAPTHVLFYDSTWTFRGSKQDWKDLLCKETGVDEAVLNDPTGLRLIPIAQRMSWASNRQTTRIEDMAYCLLGIFDVNMPLIYGEGRKAFIRLQEEIAKDSYDLSLFAWRQLDDSQDYRGILARSAAEFSHCRGIETWAKDGIFPIEFTFTNRGLRLETDLLDPLVAHDDLIWNLGCSFRISWAAWMSQRWIGIYLAKTQDGFVRARPGELFEPRGQTCQRTPPKLIYIRKMVDSIESHDIERRFERSIKVKLGRSRDSSLCITLDTFLPEGLWVENHKSFLHQGRGINAYIRSRVSLPNKTFKHIIVAFSTMDTPICTIFYDGDYLWSQINQFLDVSDDRADFVTIDKLRNTLSIHGYSLSSRAKEIIKFPELNISIPVFAELKEYTSEGGQSRFTLQISVLEKVGT